MLYTSAVLFHGPGARGSAETFLPQVGRNVHPPFGSDGLKIDEAREIIDLLHNYPISDTPAAILIGPLDRALPASSDVLLKALEEFHPQGVRPVLWANDLGAVSSTVRSRCILRWCPDPPPSSDEESSSLYGLASDLISASERRDIVSVIELLKADAKLDWVELIEWCAKVLSLSPEKLVGPRSLLWSKLRRLASYKNVGKTEVLAALIGGDEL